MTEISRLVKKSISPYLDIIIIAIMIVWDENMLGMKGFGLVEGNSPFLFRKKFSDMEGMV